jgi:Ca-activated chloride channel homolog
VNKLPFFLMGMILLVACDGSSPTTGDTQLSAAPEKASFSRQPINNSWPPMGQNVVLSQNLMAANYYIVFDGSGSMADTSCGEGGRKINAAKQALKQFIRLVPEAANIGLFVFDAAGVREVASLGADRSSILQSIDEVNASGGTPLGEAIKVGSRALTAQAQRQLGYGDYVLVVMTDGQADSESTLSNAVSDILANTPIVVHTIGFCIDDGHSLNKKGKTLYYTANSAQELSAGLQQVLAEAPDFAPPTFETKARQ